jgi:hypothetical protein
MSRLIVFVFGLGITLSLYGQINVVQLEKKCFRMTVSCSEVDSVLYIRSPFVYLGYSKKQKWYVPRRDRIKVSNDTAYLYLNEGSLGENDLMKSIDSTRRLYFNDPICLKTNMYLNFVIQVPEKYNFKVLQIFLSIKDSGYSVFRTKGFHVNNRLKE